jgi:lipopolysaccharide-induced tumor necrosis factor-alpha factor
MYFGDQPPQPAQPYQPPPPVYSQPPPPPPPAQYNTGYAAAYPTAQPNYPMQPMASPGMPPSIILPPAIIANTPQSFTCPNCRATTVSRVMYESGTGTWVCCFIIVWFGGFMGCCLIPFFNTDCQDANHFCGNCNSGIGSKKFLCN